MKFVKINHYVEKSFDDNPSFVIEMSDGLEYISNGCVFVEKTGANVVWLLARYKCELELDELLEADAIKMCDVVDASHMFENSEIIEFSSDMSSVIDASYMFFNSMLAEFSGDMSNVVRSANMFSLCPNLRN